MVADAHFEANSKTPEKRREKILSDSNKANDNNSESVGESINDSTDQNVTLTTEIVNDNLAANTQSKLNAVKVAESTDTNANSAKQKKAQSSESDTVQAQTPKADDLVSTKNTTADPIAVIKSKANGSGSAPKTKKGTLDPKRLPDSDDRINKADNKDDTVKVEALDKMTLDK